MYKTSSARNNSFNLSMHCSIPNSPAHAHSGSKGNGSQRHQKQNPGLTVVKGSFATVNSCTEVSPSFFQSGLSTSIPGAGRNSTWLSFTNMWGWASGFFLLNSLWICFCSHCCQYQNTHWLHWEQNLALHGSLFLPCTNSYYWHLCSQVPKSSVSTGMVKLPSKSKMS